MPNGSYVMPPQQGYPAGSPSPSGAVLGPPTTFIPNGMPQTASPTAATPDWQKSAPAETNSTESDKKVPDYSDDDQTSLQNFSSGPALVSAQIPEAFDPDPNAQPIQRVTNSFSLPTTSRQASAETIVTASSEQPGGPSLATADAEEGLNDTHFGHDDKNFRWLRGVVDYDQTDKTWNIIYDLQPELTDRFGGSLVLVDHPDLKDLKTGEVVQLEGFLAEEQTDRTGKPVFQIEKISHIPTVQSASR